MAKFPPEKEPKRNALQAPGRPILTHLSSFSAIGVLSTQTAPDKRPKAIGPSAIGVKRKGDGVICQVLYLSVENSF